MGYRHYFYTIPKSKANVLRNLSYPALLNRTKKLGGEDYDYVDVDMIFQAKQIYCLGKLYGSDIVDNICEKGEYLFSDEIIRDQISTDSHFYIGGKEMLEVLMAHYLNTIANSYRNMYEAISKVLRNPKDSPLELSKDDTMFLHDASFVFNMLMNCGKNLLNFKSEYRITDIGIMEFDILNLVYLYRTIDFSKNYILFYGW